MYTILVINPGSTSTKIAVYQDENVLLTHNTTIPRDITVTETRYQYETAPPSEPPATEAAVEPTAPHVPRFVGEKYNATLLHESQLTVGNDGDVVFHMPAAWVENVNTTGTSAPRDEALIKRSLIDSVAANPAFAPLADNPRFKLIVKNLEEIAR